MFQAGIAACHPGAVLPPHLPDAERPIVLAVGKAAGAMAAAAEVRYGAVPGLAVVPHGTAAELGSIALVHAGHPVPDEARPGRTMSSSSC
jgi:glycerate 2-kinase